MIQIFRAQNYGCLVSIEARLTPIHAFIGPNDSGKSTLLRGLRVVCQQANKGFQSDKGKWKPFDPRLSEDGPAALLECVIDGKSYDVRVGGEIDLRPRSSLATNQDERASEDARQRASERRAIARQIRGVWMLRLDPDALRAPSGLIPDSQDIHYLDERGTGLPGTYFALRNRGDDAFNSVVDAVRRHFPTIKTIRLKPVTTSTLELEIELQNGVRVGAQRMSEGLLYFLAFAAIRHLDPPSLLLVEEPENGLHPARIREVVRMLRTIAEEMGTQVVMATHSPLVVNELKPEEVTVVTRPSIEEGTKLTPIKETHNFEKRSSVYALGELWLSYADGDLEKPLIKGPDA